MTTPTSLCETHRSELREAMKSTDLAPLLATGEALIAKTMRGELDPLFFGEGIIVFALHRVPANAQGVRCPCCAIKGVDFIGQATSETVDQFIRWGKI